MTASVTASGSGAGRAPPSVAPDDQPVHAGLEHHATALGMRLLAFNGGSAAVRSAAQLLQTAADTLPLWATTPIVATAPPSPS
jgi:hypothetical protein